MNFKDFGRDLTIHRRSDAPASPKVSVILPTFARGHGPLQQAIDSVLSQSYADFELIVVDDGSRDGSADVLAKYVNSDPRVIVHSYASNSGLPALRVNQAALHASGEYIAYQFDDDIWLEDSLRLRVEALDQQVKPSVAYGNAELKIFFHDRPTIERVLGGPFNYALLCNGNYIANNTVIHHKKLFDIAGMYDPHVWARRFSDYDLWLRFGKVADFIWVDAPVARVHANLDDSLGKDISWDFSALRKIIGVDRNAALRPASIAAYDVMALKYLTDIFSPMEIYELIKKQSLPFLAKFNDYSDMTRLLMAGAVRRAQHRILTTKPDYSTSVDVTINNFANIKHQSVISSTFVKESDISAINPASFDLAILYRTVGAAAVNFLEKTLGEIPCAYLMDDNMLHFYEVGPEHMHLAPGTEMYQRIAHQIAAVDTCVGYSDAIVEDLASINPRTIRLNTNIPLRYIERRGYDRGARTRIAILSGSVRHGILKELWPAIQAFANRHQDTVEFHIWGIDPSEFESLDCPVYSRPFTHSYEFYLNNLVENTYDVLLVPLDASTRAARSKSPVKLLEAVACGAICIFTDATPYTELPVDCCIKVPNTLDGWNAGLTQALQMQENGRNAMLERARNHVLEKYCTERQFFDFLGACDAIRLHARLREKTIAYAFHEPALGGATLHLLKHASMARSLGFNVVGVVPGNALYADSFRERWRIAVGDAPLYEDCWQSGYCAAPTGESMHRALNTRDHDDATRIVEKLAAHNVGLLHFATWSPTLTIVGLELGVPVVASVHQFYGGDISANCKAIHAIHCSSLTYAEKWANSLQAPARRMVCAVDDIYFSAYATNVERHRCHSGAFRILVSGTLQPRKNQIEAVNALVALGQSGFDVVMELIGYDTFYPEYVEECRRIALEAGMSDRLFIHGFVDDPAPFYNRADLLLICATDESMPQTLLQAMAAGVPVVSTNVGGVSEILKHRYSGILSEGENAADLATAIRTYLLLSIEERSELIWRANRSMLVLGRTSYIRAELMDLYNEAFEGFIEKSRDTELSALNLLVSSVPRGEGCSGPDGAASVELLLRSLTDIHAQLHRLNACDSFGQLDEEHDATN